MSRTCLILGDSIALGIAAALQMVTGTPCEVRARTGAGAGVIARMVPEKAYRAAILSVGTNDEPGPRLSHDLAAIRQKLRAVRVIWIYPRSAGRDWQVYAVARAYGDAAVGLAMISSRDGVHPDDYRGAARLILALVAPPANQAEPARRKHHGNIPSARRTANVRKIAVSGVQSVGAARISAVANP